MTGRVLITFLKFLRVPISPYSGFGPGNRSMNGSPTSSGRASRGRYEVTEELIESPPRGF